MASRRRVPPAFELLLQLRTVETAAKVGGFGVEKQRGIRQSKVRTNRQPIGEINRGLDDIGIYKIEVSWDSAR